MTPERPAHFPSRPRAAAGRDTVRIRPVGPSDADELAALYSAQADFLAPYEPLRPASFFTPEGQRVAIEEAVQMAVDDRGCRFVVLVEGRIVGIVAVSNLVRGAFQSANLGYFVAREWNGLGIATRAVGLACEWAFGTAGLHRLEAGTLVDNFASQRVLQRNGFARIGLAPRYLRIAGEWRDHLLFARLADRRDG